MAMFGSKKEKETPVVKAEPAPVFEEPAPQPEIKIDYIMSCGPCRFLSAEVPAVVVSDHRPYLAEIEI